MNRQSSLLGRSIQANRRDRDRDLDPYAIALAGDCGAVPLLRPNVQVASPRRSRRLTALVLLAWLAWEAGGLVRAVSIGEPILKAMWRLA
jgi:hypothetical protein